MCYYLLIFSFIVTSPVYAETDVEQLVLKALASETHQEALVYMDEAASISPSDARVYRWRAQIKLADSNLSGALTDATKAIELDPLASALYYVRAKIRQRLGDSTGAQSDLQTAKQLDEEMDPILRKFEKRLAANPSNIDLYLDRANYQFDHNNLPEAIADYTHYIEIGGTNLDAHMYRGEIYERLNNLDAANSDYTFLINSEDLPYVHDGYLKRSQLRQRLGDSEGATEDLDRAAEVMVELDKPLP